MNNYKKRKCPICNCEICYLNKYDKNKAEKRKTACKKCADLKKKGRKQTGQTLINSRKNIKKATEKSLSIGRNPYYRKMAQSTLEEYERWIKNDRKTRSEKYSGKGNPMYGKPTPQGSGNGWANWYKGIHFRSLRELMYYILEIENKGLKSRSAQTKDLRIPYKDKNGIDRTYTADFLVEDKYLIEIKPKKLWNTNIVKIKKEAGEKFCKENGYEYILIDIQPDSRLLKEKYLNGEIKFVSKYIKRFEKYAKII